MTPGETHMNNGLAAAITIGSIVLLVLLVGSPVTFTSLAP